MRRNDITLPQEISLNWGAFFNQGSARSRALAFAARRKAAAGLAAGYLSRRQNAGEPAVFRLDHVLQMLLETEARLLGELVRVGAKSQHVHVDFLEGFQAPGRIEELDKVDTSRQFGHSALECSADGPRFRLGEESGNRCCLNLPRGLGCHLR